MMGPLLPSTMQKIEDAYDVHRYWESNDKDKLLKSIEGSCEGVVTDGGTGVSADVLKQLPNVRIVSVFGVGVDAVDLEYCQNQSIKVGNTPDVLSDDVADLAVALALACCRRLVNCDTYARSGLWATQGAMPLTTRMTGKRAGIFGLGSIGASLAKRLEGFGMSIKYCNRSQRSDIPYEYVASLEMLAESVDFLFVTASASGDALKAINSKVLEKLGPAGYLINVSRGTLVDESALISALKQNHIAGAGLDVFADEPHIPESLQKLENVVLQPHHASGTTETREAMGQLVIDNLAAHFSGEPLVTPVLP